MVWTPPLWQSIKFRVATFTLCVFATSLWSLTLYTSHMLRADMAQLPGDQQATTVSIVAAQINEQLRVRQQELELIAGGVGPELLANPAEMLGVSRRTAQLWVESGLLEAWKTDGGHRRIKRTSVQRLLDGEAKPRQRDAAPARQGEQIKVLVVEDDNSLLSLYKTVIGNWNLPIDTITAGNGVDGLIRLGRDAPDLMTTDLAMPGLDGFEMIHHLVATSYREGMDSAVVSRLDPADIEARGGLPKGVQFFSKPVPFDQLRAICPYARIWTPPRLQADRSLAFRYDCARIFGL